jgi:hypothetical protein
MDAEALKIILELKEENVILRNVITNATIMLKRRSEHLVIKQDDGVAHCLLLEIRRILEDLKKNIDE